MKYPTHIYAKALVEVLGDTTKARPRDDDAIANNFLALVRKNGDEGHLRKILEEAGRFARAHSGVRKVMIGSARALAPSQRKAVEHFIRPGDVVVERIDPDLIAGIKVTLNDELQFDGSLKNKLNKVLGSV